MRLTPSERDRLLIFSAAELARARLARGLQLNVPEATAIIADAVCEAARDGARLADAVAAGRAALRPDQVLPGVAGVVTEVAVEAVFDDGTRLVIVSEPLGPASDADPGAVLPAADAVAPLFASTVPVLVTNTADVPISVTSHFHFFEINPRLRFDRGAGYGRRLAIPAGATVRWDPGETKQVALTDIGGARIAVGFAGLVDGPLDDPGVRERAMQRARAAGYLDAGES